jgi:hypothetical protein
MSCFPRGNWGKEDSILNCCLGTGQVTCYPNYLANFPSIEGTHLGWVYPQNTTKMGLVIILKHGVMWPVFCVIHFNRVFMTLKEGLLCSRFVYILKERCC